MREYKINKYLTVKLEDSRTNIYVKGHLFRQCKFLLLNIPIDDIEKFEEIDSIDEASEKLDGSMEYNPKAWNIPPETEFIAHCSNLEAWAEHNYDTRLLERRLAFPLLRALVRAGDPRAKEVFKEEIAYRIESGYLPVVEYLIGYNYLRYFTKEELAVTFRNLSLDGIQEYDPERGLPLLKRLLERGVKKAIPHLRQMIKTQFRKQNIYLIKRLISKNYLKYLNIDEIDRLLENCPPITHFEDLDDLIILLLLKHDKVKNSEKVRKLDLLNKNLTELPNSIGILENLETLRLSYNNLKVLPNSITNLNRLKHLCLGNNELTILPAKLGNLSSLECLSLRNNNLTSLPQSLGDISSLKDLRVEHNQLSTFPNSIKDLTGLKMLNLENNNFKSLPEEIFKLKSLETLNLNKNNLKSLPEAIGDLKSLKILRLENNCLENLPNSIGKIDSLRILSLGNNRLKTLPQTIGDLNSLIIFRLKGNSIKKLPDSIGNLKRLEKLNLSCNNLINIPQSLGRLPLLRYIAVFGNSTLAIPPQPDKNLKALIELNLHGKVEKLDKWL